MIKIDDITRPSLTRENEAAVTIARNGYSIEGESILYISIGGKIDVNMCMWKNKKKMY